MARPSVKQKPHKWNASKDATSCIACDKQFCRGDLVYDDCAVNVHVGCVELYWKQQKELGLIPRPQ